MNEPKHKFHFNEGEAKANIVNYCFMCDNKLICKLNHLHIFSQSIPKKSSTYFPENLFTSPSSHLKKTISIWFTGLIITRCDDELVNPWLSPSLKTMPPHVVLLVKHHKTLFPQFKTSNDAVITITQKTLQMIVDVKCLVPQKLCRLKFSYMGYKF
jgi:hypothetical protein